MQYLGNKKNLYTYKVGFLCSRKVPSSIIIKTYDWAIAQRDAGRCVISGFHSKIEKDVLHYLLKGTQPIILVLARSLYISVPQQFRNEVDYGRLLILSPFNANVKRTSQRETVIRNGIIVDMSDELFIPYISPGGQLEKLYTSTIKFSNKVVRTI